MNSFNMTPFEAMDIFPRVPMKYLRPVYTNSKTTTQKFVLPGSPQYIARINLIDYLAKELQRFCDNTEKITQKNLQRFKTYNKLQSKLLACESHNKPVKTSLLDNMARLLKNIAQNSNVSKNIKAGVIRIV